MKLAIEWVNDYLPKNKPVHILGVGRIDDILDLVIYGIDTFDCTEPTRIARTGIIYQINRENLKIFKYN
jgi:Queuine/archaeosine tRNA-ribosyltransferase